VNPDKSAFGPNPAISLIARGFPEGTRGANPQSASAFFAPWWRIRMNSQARLLSGQSALAVAAQGVRIGLALLIIPISLSYLGKERYGLWMLALSTLSCVGLLDAGVSPALKNKMAESFARRNEDAFHSYASMGWLLAFSVLALGIVFLPVLARINWARIYGIAGQAAGNEAQRLTLACFAISALTLSLSFVEALFASRMLLGTVYIYNMCAAFASAAAVFGAVHLRAGLVTLAVAASASQIAARAALLVTARRRGLIRFSLPLGRLRSLLREVLPASASFLGIQVTGVILGAVPNLVTSRLAGLSAVATLAIGLRVVTLPLAFVEAIVPVHWPAFTIAWAKGNLDWIRGQFARLVGTTSAVLGLYALAILFAGPAVVHLWLRGSLSVPRSIMATLGLWLVLQGIGHWISTFLHSITDLHSQVICYIVQALTTTWMCVLLCPRYGLMGISTAMVAALILTNLAPLGWRVYGRLQRSGALLAPKFCAHGDPGCTTSENF
jgi:O-antigen/teichoic acid export membrane protein